MQKYVSPSGPCYPRAWWEPKTGNMTEILSNLRPRRWDPNKRDREIFLSKMYGCSLGESNARFFGHNEGS
jgi:hypothetical protein